jgi:FAD-linked oxidoreductase
VPTEGTLLNLDRLSGPVSFDQTRETVRMKAGTRLYAVSEALEEQGRALFNMPDINKQTFAGAISTATHGTGKDLTALHGEVTALRFVTPTGEVVSCSETLNPDVFRAAQVSLGSLGILTQIETRTRPFHRLRKTQWFEPFEDVIANAPERASEHRHWESYYLPYTGMSLVITNDETEDEIWRDETRDDNKDMADLRMLESLTWWAPPLRRFLSRRLMSDVGTSSEVDAYWRVLSSEQRAVRFNEMEYHIPAEAAQDCFREVVRAVERAGVRVFFPFEFRYIKGDDAWLSPFEGGDRCSIAVHRYFEEDPTALQAVAEPIFRDHGGRPHWGKMNTLTASDFAELYPHWDDFLNIRERFDPEGRLLTPYMRTVFGV